MNKLKLFLENFVIYGIGGIISKIIPLLMLPIITRIMPNPMYYGISDMSNTIVQFGSAIAIMGMYDAMYRLFFEKDDVYFKKQVCSTTLVFTVIMSLTVSLLIIIFKNKIGEYFLGEAKYYYVIYLSAISTLLGATNGIVSAPTRMQNKRKVFLVTNTIAPILSYGISIPMLLAGNYVISLPLAGVISSLVMEICFIILNKKWFKFNLFNFTLLKQLLLFAIPLLPNILIYWLFNSCDRIMITKILGIEAAGVYSVASKIGQCSQLIYTAFAGGWQFFAFSTMKEKEQVKSNSKIFEYLSLISFISTAVVCVFSYTLFRIIFGEEYLEGYVVAPYLFFAPLLQMLFQVSGNQFLVIKKTWPIPFILSGGVIANIILNYFLIARIGIEGAAIATLVGYSITVIVCIIVLKYMKLILISKRFILSSTIIFIYIISWRYIWKENLIWGIVSFIIYILILLKIYNEDVKKIFELIKKADNSR